VMQAGRSAGKALQALKQTRPLLQQLSA